MLRRGSIHYPDSAPPGLDIAPDDSGQDLTPCPQPEEPSSSADFGERPLAGAPPVIAGTACACSWPPHLYQKNKNNMALLIRMKL
jgi:hypothetical protein